MRPKTLRFGSNDLASFRRPDGNQHNLRSAAYEALMEMVKNSPRDCYITVQKTTMIILERLQRVLQMEVSGGCWLICEMSSKAGSPVHKENRENGKRELLSGLTQNFVKAYEILYIQVVKFLILSLKDTAIFPMIFFLLNFMPLCCTGNS